MSGMTGLTCRFSAAVQDRTGRRRLQAGVEPPPRSQTTGWPSNHRLADADVNPVEKSGGVRRHVELRGALDIGPESLLDELAAGARSGQRTTEIVAGSLECADGGQSLR
jgi:hypothetical protein